MKVDKELFYSFIDSYVSMIEAKEKFQELEHKLRVNFREYNAKALFIDGIAYFINSDGKLSYSTIDKFFFCATFVKWNYGIKYYDDIKNFSAWSLYVKRKGGKVLKETCPEAQEYIKQVVEQGYIN